MNKLAIEIKWGILFSIATLVWMIIEDTVGLHDVYISKQAIYTNLFAVIAIAIYVLAIREKKYLYYKGIMTWKQGFISGVVLSVVITILSPLVQYITFKYITPNFFSNSIQYCVDLKKLTQTQAEAYFSLKSYIIQGVFGGLSMGIVNSALISLVLKTKK